jgi:predicted O-methyltransferase YrrM
MNEPKSLTPERILQLAWGFAPTLIIQAAVQHRLFDHLAESPRTLAELASATGASARGLKAILNALVGLQLLSRSGDRYQLEPESAAFLVSTKPAYHGGFFKHMSHLLERWLELKDVVQTGRPISHQKESSEAPEFFAGFVESLFPLAYAAAQKLGQHLQLAGAKSPLSVLDIGAGSGVWGIALAQQSPLVTVRAVDWPRVLEVTEKIARRCGVADRLTLAPGDLLEADFGTGHKVATIGHILHGEGPERNQQLLRRTFQALAPGGTVAIAEFLPNEERTGPPGSLLFAVNMLVNTEAGDTYTFGEISSWLKEAGFVDPRLLDVPSVSPLVLATRPC